jgi:hypothetical protein
VTAERYTAVCTGFFIYKKPGEYLYLTMTDEPFALGGSILRRGLPPYERMGRQISFEDLPEDCRRLVLDVYWNLWSLLEDPSLRSTDGRRMRRA